MASNFMARPDRRRWRLAAALPALVALALVASCDLIAGVDELVAKEPCETAADCPTPKLCHTASCDYDECIEEPVEEGTDCGGGYRHCDALGRCLCPPVGCANGAPCEQDGECESWFCAEGTCADTPCGGACPGVCWQCSQATNNCEVLPLTDTAGGACPDGCDGQGNCQSCTNKTIDPSETDEDCGGPRCPPCADYLMCDVPADCQSCLCEDNRCAPPACGNYEKDGCETDVDCGGPCGSTCAPGEQCNSKQDCAYHDCTDGICGEAG